MICRASGAITASHACQPFSIFNIINFDRAQMEEGKAGGMTFNTIAKQVLKHEKKASSGLEVIEKCRSICEKDANISRTINNIQRLFAKKAFRVFGNHGLRDELV
ncbi:hypothetical protein BGX23_002597 [Mortierella sp. AD031]|nr:hypothetical protein BGX23_002597 [Mortierella sp. AD031]KAG0214589.1 hypothetical protein BGX33_002011 [Mortierella sp. NVP41]